MKKLFYLTVTLFTVFSLTSASKCSSDDDDTDPYYEQIMRQGFTYSVVKNPEVITDGNGQVIVTMKGSVTGEIVNTYTYENNVLQKMDVTLDYECGDAIVANLVYNYYSKQYSKIKNVKGLDVNVVGTAVKASYSINAEDMSGFKEYEEFANNIDGLYNYWQGKAADVAASYNGTQVQ